MRWSRLLWGLALVAVSGAVAISVIWKAYWIPVGSMKPALLVGDYLVANRFYGTPARGEIFVFRHPVNETPFIMRIIGLPDDKVQMKGGVLQINGEAVTLESAGSFEEVFAPQGPMRSRPRCENGGVGPGEICVKSMQTETLPGGVAYPILNITDQRWDNTTVIEVPDGHYFFIGDNRDNSNDSRIPQVMGGVGFVPEDNLIARADTILFSSAGRSLWAMTSWRSDRFLEPVR